MKIYRVSHYDDGPTENHTGYSFFSNKKQAMKDLANARDMDRHEDDPDMEPRPVIDVLDFPITKKGILIALSCWGSHADNG